MGKHKGLLVSIVAVVLVGTVGIYLAQKFHAGQSESFTKSGYVIEANEQAESARYAFSEGTSYREKYPNAFAFDDTTGAKVEIGKESYVHYDDDSVSALTDGVVMNLADLNHNGSINHYRIGANMLMEKQANAYQLETLQGTMKIEEGIWKISDTRYLLFASNIDVFFDEADSRSAGTFVEINYIDDGVIQLLTKENVWQSVSTTAYAKTSNGVEVKLFDQLIKNGEVQMTFNKLVVSSDENIVLSPLEKKNQQVPTFDIKTEDGTNGSTGEGGVEGNAGTSGTNGTGGNKGVGGSIGSNGQNGTSGGSGTSGKNGVTGNQGQSGNDANQESSMKTAIPNFIIDSWKLDATSVSGTMKITDDNAMLTADDAKIVVYEAGSGEAISCLNDDGDEGFNVQGESLSFHTDAGIHPLKPDTEYRFVLTARYEMNGKLYDREFISRVFYTDSLGIYIDKKATTTDSITINLEKKEYAKAESVDVYLLTQEQAETFDPTSTANYIVKTTSMDANTKTYETVFTKDDSELIKSNQKFVVRAVVKMGGKQYLTQQSLNLATLKIAPTLSNQLYVIRNRPLNGFELYSGAVNDPDKAVIEQRYEIYDADENSPYVNELVKSMQIEPGTGTQSTMLYLDKNVIKTSHPYKFRLVTLYSDNEKIIEVVSDYSEVFKMNEAHLPALSFYVASEDRIQYDHIEGELVIDLNGSSMTIDQKNPLTINIDCEGVYAQTINITDSSGYQQVGDQIRVNINLNGLKSDSTYRFRASGYVDLKDGDKTQLITIGNVVKATKPLTVLNAEWRTKQNSAYAVSQVLKLTAADGASWEDIDASYDANSLSKINVELFKGSGAGKTPMKSITFVDTDTNPRTSSLVEDFVKNGREISEVDFGYPSNLLTDTVYTIRINAVYDYTALDGYEDVFNISNYTNEYMVSETTQEVIITKASQPPALPDISTINDQIKSTPIYNKEAGVYGKIVDPSLSNDTIVGYLLEPNYDNYAKLARNVYYYVFESNKYNSLISKKENPIFDGTNLLTTGKWLYKKEIPVTSTNSNIPSCALFFGDGTDSVFNGTYISYTGKAVTDSDGLVSGMGRGYKYTFAYAVNYNAFGAGEGDTLYPYEHPTYKEISDATSIPYVLNSGIKDAPKTEPSFLTYPYESNIKDGAMDLTLKYRYTDPDKTITKGDTDFLVGGKPNGNKIDVDINTWGETTFAGIVANNLVNGQFKPLVTRKLYNLPYAGVVDSKVITTQPIDLSTTFDNAKVRTMKYDVFADLERNQVKVHIKDTSSNEYLKLYNKKIAGVSITFSDADDPDGDRITLVLTLDKDNTATISTAKLEKLLNKNIQTQVSLLYDTNKIGWNLQNESGNYKRFALQMINRNGVDLLLDTYTVFDEQSATLINTSPTSSGSIFSTSEHTWLNFNTIERTQDATFTTPLRSDIKGEYKFRAGENGIGRVYEENASTLNLLVPKELAYGGLILDAAQNFKLEKIIPSVSADDVATQGLDYVILNGVDFSGVSLIDANVSNKKIVTLNIQNANTSKLITQSVDVTNWKSVGTLKIENLEPNTIYYISMSAPINGKATNLLDSKTSSVFKKTIKTKGNVDISKLKVQYKAESYKKQVLQASYTLDLISGYYLDYSITDEFDQVVMTAKQMQEAGMYTAYGVDELYTTTKVETFNLFVTKHGLKANTKYKLRVNAYQVLDGNVMYDQPLGYNTAEFTIPIPSSPIVFTNMAPEYHKDTKKIDMNITFSVADSSHIIMSDYTKEDDAGPVYFVRFYKLGSDNSLEDVTPTDQLYKQYTPGTNYKMTLSDVSPNTNFKVVIYAPIDKDRNGACDDDETLQGSLASYDQDTFETNKDSFNIWEDVQTTPGENGISYGDVSIENPNRDPSKIAIAYKNASNLNSIVKIEYTVISSDGKSSYGGTIDNKDGTAFVEKAGLNGYYSLNIPITLDSSNLYRVILNYYLEADGKPVGNYSTTYLYEK